LFNSYQSEKKRAEGLRVKLSKGEVEGKAPEDIKEYVVELDDSLKGMVPDGDPLMLAAKEAAKAAGLPKEAFGKFMLPVITKLAEIKAAADVGPSDEEIAAARNAEIEKLGPTGSKIVGAIGSFISQLESGGAFTAAEANAARAMANNADAVRVLNKLRMMSNYGDQVPMDMPIGDNSSRSEIEAKMGIAMRDGNEAEYTKLRSQLDRTK